MIRRGDGELNYAYYLFSRHGILPSGLAKMERREQARVFAMVDLALEEEQAVRK